MLLLERCCCGVVVAEAVEVIVVVVGFLLWGFCDVFMVGFLLSQQCWYLPPLASTEPTHNFSPAIAKLFLVTQRWC